MPRRPPPLSPGGVLLAALLVLAGCASPPAPPSPATVARRDSSSSSVLAVPAVVHDRGEVRVVARSADGAVWGVGPRGGEALLRWEADGWRKIESLSDLPGGVIALAADPAAKESVVSLWSGRSGAGGDRSVLHLYRHSAGRDRVVLASFANPTADERGDRGLTPTLAVDAGGDVWLAFPFPLLMRIPGAGGEPERIELAREWFSPMAGRDITRYLPLRFTPDAAAGEGWLWSVVDESRPSRRGALSRPLRVAEGRPRLATPLDGLPAEGRVTCVVADGPGRAVWALEGGGLWDIDLATGRATARPSPPEAWRILDFARPTEGIEVALSVAPRRGADRLVGEIWIRVGDGEWRSAGPSGDIQAGTLSADGWLVRPRAWAVVDGLLLGAGFNSGLVGVDLREDVLSARSLDWRAGVRTGPTRELFPLPDGRVLVQGVTASAAIPAVWRKAWLRAGDMGPEDMGLARLPASTIRAPDGRLWSLTVSGRGAPVVEHWDSARWRRWPLPEERAWWPEDGFWVEAGSGRAVVAGEGPKTPAWERDETAEGGWRRFASMLEWLAFRADSGDEVAVLPRMREGYLRRPVYGPEGRVLIGWSGALWLRRDGEWRMYSTKELGATPWRYGFDETGEPWFATQRERRRLLADGSLGEQAPWHDREAAHGGYSHASNRPDWIDVWCEGRRVDAVHPDEDGVWWLLSDGELWAAREREFVRVFSDEDASPFRVGRSGSFVGVLTDERGNRLFLAYSPVLLPALPAEEIRVDWVGTDDPADRVARVSGGGRAEWRLNFGPWRSAPGGLIELRELPPGEHRLEVRAENARLCPGPVHTHELKVTYDVTARVNRLLGALTDKEHRAEAVTRLGRMGVAVESRLRAALEEKPDDERAWWLRAALQAIEDAEKRGSLP